MGNCGSTVDCSRCYSYRDAEGCDTVAVVNPDVAGIGVFVSFFLSALLIGGVILWGYWMESLPSGLLTSTDHYVLHMIKNRTLQFGAADIAYNVSTDRIRRRRIVTGYLKVLGVQQLIIGLAIVIAGLANRCQITLYEFNLVTSFAYFAAFTHLCSLYILQECMYNHGRARTLHVVFTTGFLALFCLAFIITNSAIDEPDRTWLNSGNPLQCFFDASRYQKTLGFGFLDGFALAGGLVAHVRVLGNFHVPLSSDFTKTVVYRVMGRDLGKSGLPKEGLEAIVRGSELKYLAWIRPPGNDTPKPTISFWYLVEAYHNAKLSFIHSMLGFFSYDTIQIMWPAWCRT